MIDAFSAILQILVVGGLGAVLARWLRPAAHRAAATGGWGWSLLLGAAAVGLALQVPLAIDGRISHLSFALVAVAGALACGWLVYAVGRNLWPVAGARSPNAGNRQLTADNVPWRTRLARTLGWLADLPWPGKVVAAVLLGCTLYHAATTEITGYDGRSIFALKARILYDKGTVRGEDFCDVQRMNINPSYPLLLPLLEAQLFWIQGSYEGHCLILLLLVFPTGIASVLASEIRRFDDRRIAALAALMLLLTPVVLSCYEGGGQSGSADLVVAAFVFAGVIEVSRWLEQPSWRPAVGAALLWGAAVTTKTEGGLICVLAGMAALAGGCLLRRIRPLGGFAAGGSAALGCGLVAAAWGLNAAVHRGMPASPYHPSYLAFDSQWLKQLGDRPWQVLVFAAKELLRTPHWNLVWFGIFAPLLLLRRHRLPGKVWWWRVMVVSVVGLDILAMIVTPMRLQYELNTTFYRLLVQVLPLAFLLGCEQLAAAGWTRSFAAVWWPDVKHYRVDPPAVIQREEWNTARAA